MQILTIYRLFLCKLWKQDTYLRFFLFSITILFDISIKNSTVSNKVKSLKVFSSIVNFRQYRYKCYNITLHIFFCNFWFNTSIPSVSQTIYYYTVYFLQISQKISVNILYSKLYLSRIIILVTRPRNMIPSRNHE